MRGRLVPGPEEIDFPALLDLSCLHLTSYTRERVVVAEVLGILEATNAQHTRMKVLIKNNEIRLWFSSSFYV